MNLSIESMLHRMCFRALVSWLALAGAAVSGSNLYAAALSPPTAVIVKGETAWTRIEYRSQGSAVSGLQFDLQYDRRMLYIEVSIGSGAAAVGKALTTTVLPNGDLRILIGGFNQTVIGDGGAVDLNIKMSVFASTGPHPLGITNVVGVKPDGTGVSVRRVGQGRITAIPQ